MVVNSPRAVEDTDRRRSLTRSNNGRIFRQDGPLTRSSALGSIRSEFTIASRWYTPCITRCSSPRQAPALSVRCQTRPLMSLQGETRGEPPSIGLRLRDTPLRGVPTARRFRLSMTRSHSSIILLHPVLNQTEAGRGIGIRGGAVSHIRRTSSEFRP